MEWRYLVLAAKIVTQLIDRGENTGSERFQNNVTQVGSGRAETQTQKSLILEAVIFLGLNIGFISYSRRLLSNERPAPSPLGQASLLDQATAISYPSWVEPHDKVLRTFPLHMVLSIKVSIQLSSVTQSCPILCEPMDCSMPGLLVHHQLPEFTQTHVH